MMHLYLSPHLDDAALSCGGAIHRHRVMGEQVSVVTIFAGSFEGGDLSSFALRQHGYWGNPPRPMALRRAEDLAALTLLGAETLYLDYLDAVYRAAPQGRWLYPDLEALVGDIHPLDPIYRDGTQGLADQLASLAPPGASAVIYAPLGAGNHVDHQLVCLAARELVERGCRVAFYEDYPYAEKAGALEAALGNAGIQSWDLETIQLGAVDLVAKVSAVGYYHTQMGVLFGGAGAMPSRLWSFAADRSSTHSLCERIWWPR
jgi:LmbE family N-acetylglucosaminyl deacetylase